MNIDISLDGNAVTLSLKEGERIVDSVVWTADNTLSKELLVKIDSLLAKNSVKVADIENVSSHVSETSGITSARIVETIALAWNNAKNLK